MDLAPFHLVTDTTALRVPLLVAALTVVTIRSFRGPIRRVLHLRRLRSTRGPDAAAEVLRNWQIVVIGLGDLGQRPLESDSAVRFARRALERTDWLDPAALLEIAAMADRARRGPVPPEDADQARVATEMAYQAARDLVSPTRQLWSWYRIL